MIYAPIIQQFVGLSSPGDMDDMCLSETTPSARSTFPQPGGPHSISDGTSPDSRTVRRMELLPTAASCPIKSSTNLGLMSSARGTDGRGGAGPTEDPVPDTDGSPLPVRPSLQCNRGYAADVTVGYYRIFSVSPVGKRVVGSNSTAILETRAVVKLACLVPQPLLSSSY